MAGLWRKELRSQLPFLALVVVITMLGGVYELFAGIPSGMPLAESHTDYVANEKEATIVFFVVAFALASGLLVREHDEGTMEFLDSLPVSRSRVFVVKVFLALFILSLFIVLDISVAIVLHALSRNSLDPSFHLRFLATAAGLRLVQAIVFLSLGLSLSFFRRFGWLIVGLLFWSYTLLLEYLPGIAVLNLFALASPHFEGQRLIVPEKLLAVQLTLGGCLLAFAYLLFLGAGDALLRWYGKLTQSRPGNAFLAAAGLAIAIVSFSLIYQVMENDPETNSEESDEEVTITYPSWSTSRSSTQHYLFLYPTNLTGRASRLAREADQVYEQVRRFFAAEAGETIVVDATSIMPRHAGVAYWDKIRLDLASTDDLHSLQAILAHESSHIFLERLSDSRMGEKFNSTRFFHEGVASYVEYHLYRSEEELSVLRSIAAVMQARREVKFAELVDSSLLSARRDTNLVYPLGEVFVAALVSRYGEEAIGKIVRALVRKDAPQDLQGLTLWRDSFQACGYNLDDVLDAFYAELDAEVERHRGLIDSLPRLRGAFASDDDLFYVTVDGDPPDGWRPVCRFRQAVDSPDRLNTQGQPIGSGVFVVSRAAFPGSTLWCQLGLTDGNERVIYEPWLEVNAADTLPPQP